MGKGLDSGGIMVSSSCLRGTLRWLAFTERNWEGGEAQTLCSLVFPKFQSSEFSAGKKTNGQSLHYEAQ